MQWRYLAPTMSVLSWVEWNGLRGKSQDAVAKIGFFPYVRDLSSADIKGLSDKAQVFDAVAMIALDFLCV